MPGPRGVGDEEGAWGCCERIRAREISHGGKHQWSFSRVEHVRHCRVDGGELCPTGTQPQPHGIHLPGKQHGGDVICAHIHTLGQIGHRRTKNVMPDFFTIDKQLVKAVRSDVGHSNTTPG